ncbi:MAG: hypothetical protein Q8891_15910 [Bacteroidota bacterium]|nr:hypothetical protein [Bacteroidota bacterium]
MSGNKKYTFRKVLVIAVWVVLGSGLIVLLVAAITRKNNEQVTGVEINISGIQNENFIYKKDVLKVLEKVNGKSFKSATVSSLNLTEMENALQKNSWIKRAEIFFDNNNVLQVKITEKEPVARIFTTSGASFYLDSSLTRLPLSDKFSARLPVFTNFPTEVKVLSHKDSILLNEIKMISEYIKNHPFWMAQIDQVNITPEYTFELIPKLGNQLIRFGDGDQYEEKFNKLLAFYKQVETRAGWNRYSILDLRFKNQVIGVNRNAKEIKIDSLRAVQIMNDIITNAEKSASDSANVQLTQPEDDNSNINNSREIQNITVEKTDKKQINTENNKVSGSVTPIHVPEKPIFKKPELVKSKPLTNHPSSYEKPGPARVNKTGVKREIEKKPEDKTKRVPKAIMPAKSDY